MVRRGRAKPDKALPLLEAMSSSASALEASTAARKRLQVIYTPNGMMMENWTPKTEGVGYELSPILKPLEPFRDKTLMLHGVCDRIRGDGDDFTSHEGVP